jgi:hypothetical protein
LFEVDIQGFVYFSFEDIEVSKQVRNGPVPVTSVAFRFVDGFIEAKL